MAAAHEWDGLRAREARFPGRCRPRVPPQGRWTPARKWPVLTAGCEAGRGPAPPARPPSGSRWPSRAAPRWPVRCAAATSRGARAPGSAVVSLRPRRCSCRAGTVCSRLVSTSRGAIENSRFCPDTEADHGHAVEMGTCFPVRASSERHRRSASAPRTIRAAVVHPRRVCSLSV